MIVLLYFQFDESLRPQLKCKYSKNARNEQIKGKRHHARVADLVFMLKMIKFASETRSKPKTMNKIILTMCLMALGVMAQAVEWQWYNPMDAGFPTVQNQAYGDEIDKTYYRMPDRAKQSVRKDVWDLSRNSAGLAVYFSSDADQFKIRYVVTGGKAMSHMPATGVSGIDLYRVDGKGDTDRCVGYWSFGDTVSYSIRNTVPDHHKGEPYDFRLYLPLYNTVEWLEIGIPEGAKLTFMPAEKEKPVVVYGTSIAQGACASRPGMCWTNIVQRELDMPLVNFGFSGNGRLEPEVLDFMNEIDSRLFILDCLPNLDTEKEADVEMLLRNAIEQLRKKGDISILLVDHIGFSNIATDSVRKINVAKLNRVNKRVFEDLKKRGVRNLHHLAEEQMGLKQDDWVDDIHPSDLGMRKQADAVIKKVAKILNIK